MIKFFKSLLFKYKAWKILKLDINVKSTDAVDRLMLFEDAYKNFSLDNVSYAAIKNHTITCRDINIRNLIEDITLANSVISETNSFPDDFLNGSLRELDAASFLLMSYKNSKQPNYYINSLVKVIIETLSEFKKFDKRTNYISSIRSYNLRKLIPLAELAREIIKLTLLAEGVSGETIRIYYGR